MPCMVYFVVYDNSIQEQQYLTTVRSEKEAFEHLIMYKAGMTPSTDQVAYYLSSFCLLMMNRTAGQGYASNTKDSCLLNPTP